VDEPCASLPAVPPRRARARRGNCRFFDTGKRNLARDGLSAGGSRIRTCMGLFPVKWCFSVYCQFFVRSGKGPLFIPSPTIRFPERAEWGQGTETLAKLGA